jgi:cytochrome c553
MKPRPAQPAVSWFPRPFSLLAAAVALAGLPVTARAAETPPTAQQLEFFEKKIRPVLVANCYSCHSAEAEKVKGSLYVDTREGLRMGGDNGHAVVPGDVEGSLLIKAIRYRDSDLAMPPKKEGGKLPDEVIADFEQWVRMGAPDPREGQPLTRRGVDWEKAREHWAFQPPVKSPPPAVKNTAWPRTDIDRFVLAALEQQQLTPVGDADRRTLIRRVYFDLIGLPPTPQEVEAFLKDTDPRAFEKVVDRLLASPQYGEKWGRHWLDVARYAESSGKENNVIYPHAWRYRDYVIKSFNQDKPYDRFLKEQLAGDLLPARNATEEAETLIATGLLAIGPKSHNTRDPRQFALDLADEQIDAITQGMLGLTVACARCHDHKFDPITQTDYYAMAGIFLSTETRFGTPRFVQNNQATPLFTLPAEADLADAPPISPQQVAALKRQLELLQQQREELLTQMREEGQGSAAQLRLLGNTTQLSIVEKVLGRYDDQGRPKRLAMGVQDKLTPRDTPILQRGELDKPLNTVPRGFVQVLAPKTSPRITQGSGRLELAGWIASKENPLTARVMVNRVWLQLFGRGIVATPDNFGTTGQKPTHPALLDYLAVSFMDNGWSVKSLIRQIVLSRTYQLASDHHEQNYAADPDNHWLWRMSQRRLDAEAIRDAMLAVSGKLDLTPPDGSPVASFEGPAQQLTRPLPGAFGAPGGPGNRRPGSGMFGGRGFTPPPNPVQQDRNYRSVYLPIVRDMIPEPLATFDFAEPSLVVGDRDDTTVPSQALYLLNNASVHKLAEAMADRLIVTRARGADLGQAAFTLAFSRPPTPGELAATQEFFKKFYAAEGKPGEGADTQSLARRALIAFCQSLFGSAEFRYLN